MSASIDIATEADRSQKFGLEGLLVLVLGQVNLEEASVRFRQALSRATRVVVDRVSVILCKLDWHAGAAPRELQVQLLVFWLKFLDHVPEPLDDLVFCVAALVLSDLLQPLDVKLLQPTDPVVNLINRQEFHNLKRHDNLVALPDRLLLVLGDVASSVAHQLDVILVVGPVDLLLSPAWTQLDRLSVDLLSESLINQISVHVVVCDLFGLLSEVTEHGVRQTIDRLNILLGRFKL